MYCRSCGEANPDNAFKCTRCGQPLQPGGANFAPANVSNFLVPAILVTIFCCLPTGIAAIVFAAQVNTKLQLGDVPGAVKASNSAKMWTWISFGLGLAGCLIYGVIAVIGGFASAAAGN